MFWMILGGAFALFTGLAVERKRYGLATYLALTCVFIISRIP